MGINYYSTLCLKRHCTKDDVHKAFGKLVSKYSLTNQAHNHNLITLCEAYEVLSEQFRRVLYDQYGEDGIKKGIQSNDLYIEPWIYHGNVMTTYSNYCALKNPISCLHIKCNGYVAIHFKENKNCHEEVKLSLKLTLNEIFYGTTKLIPVEQKLTEICNSISNRVQSVKITVPRGFPTGGTLRSQVLKSVTGLEDTQTLFIFTTEDIPHEVFKRDNMNLVMVKKIFLKQALFGLKINFKTLDHKDLRVNITQVITHDYTKIIYNEGMPNMDKPTQRGNIIIKFDIIYPLYLLIKDETFCELTDTNETNT